MMSIVCDGIDGAGRFCRVEGGAMSESLVAEGGALRPARQDPRVRRGAPHLMFLPSGIAVDQGSGRRIELRQRE